MLFLKLIHVLHRLLLNLRGNNCCSFCTKINPFINYFYSKDTPILLMKVSIRMKESFQCGWSACKSPLATDKTVHKLVVIEFEPLQ